MLQQRLAAFGACWGNDPVGERFGVAYSAAAGVVQNNMTALSTGLVRIAAALRAVAESYEATERAVDPGALAGASP
jgi:uncharacterized protein YukE